MKTTTTRAIASRPAIATALAAVAMMTASPVVARDYGWGRRHHHDRIDGGDIFAGVLILGGIAAIASAASKSSRDRRQGDYRYPDREDRPEWSDRSGNYGDWRERDDRRDRYGAGTRGADTIDEAVERCASEVERGDSRRIETVDGVNREGDGWRVQGRTSSGRDFACSVDRDGRIRSVTIDGQAI